MLITTIGRSFVKILIAQTRGLTHFNTTTFWKILFLHNRATPPYGRPRKIPADVSIADVPVYPNSLSIVLRYGMSSGSNYVSCKATKSQVRHSSLILSTDLLTFLQLKLAILRQLLSIVVSRCAVHRRCSVHILVLETHKTPEDYSFRPYFLI